MVVVSRPPFHRLFPRKFKHISAYSFCLVRRVRDSYTTCLFWRDQWLCAGFKMERPRSQCFLCDEQAAVICIHCEQTMSMFCSSCDQFFHKRRDRSGHERRPMITQEQEDITQELGRIRYHTHYSIYLIIINHCINRDQHEISDEPMATNEPADSADSHGASKERYVLYYYMQQRSSSSCLQKPTDK